MRLEFIKSFSLLLLLTFAFTSLSASEPLKWAGCGITKKAFMEELANAYTLKTGTEIILEGGGATKGIRRVNNMEVDIGGSCRNRIKGHPEERYSRLNPVAWDALVVIVHKDNPIDNISIDDLKRVIENKITNWSELTDSKEDEIEFHARQGKISGVGRLLRGLVFGDYDQDFMAHTFHPSTGPLELAVENSPNAIAVSGISSARKRDVKIISLNGYTPTPENIYSGNYILYRPLYIVTNVRNPRYNEVNDFLKFAHTPEGREIIQGQGVVPYLDAVHLLAQHRKQLQTAHRNEVFKP